MMTFQLALSHSPSGRFLLVALILLCMKLAATVLQVVLTGRDQTVQPKTRFFRLVYVTGKVTPALGGACAFASALLLKDHLRSWIYGVDTIAVALLAMYVVRLRKQNRFFGLMHLLTSKR